jgi:CDP-glycerol glycerophosphotransferase
MSKIELATACVIISNVKGGLPFRKKRTQYYIQTWHGGFGVKFIEKEIEDSLSASYVRSSKHDSSITDLILSGSEFQTKVIKDAFWYDGEIFKKGVPRNDIFFNVTEDKVSQLKQKYGFQKTDRIVLYAPTFRDDKSSDAYHLNGEMLLQTLVERTGLQWKLIVRLHPLAACYHDIFHYDSQVIDGSDFPDSQELLVMSDLLITDFSSMMMDFAIMKKPVLLFITDLEQYIQHCRDVRPIFYQLPFALAHSNEELRQAVMEYQDLAYQKRLKSFMDEHFQSYDDGHASEYVVERIKSVMDSNFIKR